MTTITPSTIGAAPDDAKYIVQTASSGLSAEQALGSLATGLLKNTAANNVVGDSVTLVSDGITTWYMTAQLGAWSAT